MTRLETDRLVIREISLADAAFILELLNEPAFIRFIGDKGVRDLAGAEKYIREGPLASYARHGFGLWCVTLNAALLPAMLPGVSSGVSKRASHSPTDAGPVGRRPNSINKTPQPVAGNVSPFKDGTPIGMCGLLKRDFLKHPDLGYALLARFSGQGYAHEAAAAVLRHAREQLKLTTLHAITAVNNPDSIKLLGKLGFDFVEFIQQPGYSEPSRLFVAKAVG